MRVFNKRNILILFIIILGVVFTACRDASIPKEGKDIDLTDIDVYIQTKVKHVLNNYKGLNINEIKVREDGLLLNRGSYRKTINNMFVDISLDIDENIIQDEDALEITESFKNSLLKEISEEKASEIVRIREINFIYLNDSLNDGIVFIQTNDETKSLYIEQSDDLNKLDKEIYTNFKENIEIMDENLEYYIGRMGVQNDSFLMEVNIYYFNLDNYEEALRNINLETIDYIKQDTATAQNLKDKGINNISFIYNAKWYKTGEPLIFEYELN